MSYSTVKPGTTIASARLGFLHPAPVSNKTLTSISSNVNEASGATSTEPNSSNNKQHVMINVNESLSAKNDDK